MAVPDFKIYQKKLSQSHPDAVWMHGDQRARAMLVGLEPCEGEKIPFTVGGQMYLRHVLNHMQVPTPFLLFNYLVKEPNLIGKPRDFWIGHTHNEIRNYVKPKAVVLLGLRVYNELFNENVTEIDQIRRTRIWNVRIPHTTFFVTHAPEDVLSKEESGDDTLSKILCQDLLAVFEVSPTHFMKTRTVGSKD